MPEIRLDGDQRRRLSEALLAAFGRAELERLLSYELDVDLDRIAGGGDLPETVFEVIRWAERQGRVVELIGAARRVNPGNDQLRQFADEITPPAAPPVDLSEWVTIHDQGAEGSVVAMATVTAMETALARKGRRIQLSARYLFQKARQHDGLPPSAEGGFFEAVLYVAQFFGVPDEDAWPYVAGDRELPKGKSWDDIERAPKTKARAYRLGGVKDIPFHLGEGRPIVVGIPIYEAAFMSEDVARTGVVTTDFDRLVGGHGITIVGYEPSDGSMRFANSWGTAWGDHGFGRLSAEVMEKLQEPQSDAGLEMYAVDAD